MTDRSLNLRIKNVSNTNVAPSDLFVFISNKPIRFLRYWYTISFKKVHRELASVVSYLKRHRFGENCWMGKTVLIHIPPLFVHLCSWSDHLVHDTIPTENQQPIEADRPVFTQVNQTGHIRRTIQRSHTSAHQTGWPGNRMDIDGFQEIANGKSRSSTITHHLLRV